MAGYRDWLSQGASSSAAPSLPNPAAIPDPDELEFLSQGPSRARAAPSLSVGRVNMQDLDLNSQDEAFPYLDEYTDILESGRGRGDGGRLGSFQPPRQTDGGVPIGRGRGATARGGRRGRGRRGTASLSPPSEMAQGVEARNGQERMVHGARKKWRQGPGAKEMQFNQERGIQGGGRKVG
ncbi:uncharacterized protein C2845_PM01G38960 [Panicum miliaceum]|uniref:Uncharacterized protein n=1 Tax=Panicum miliaceum TaxID=4540 RepID=A0A3L6TJ65_PANMI|nr:uncharacterized protein C2845_PM01G38960 [Panicum miliaceum]